MTHVSQKEVADRWLEKMSELLLAATTQPSSARGRKKVLMELLTDTEKLMLAKRVALVAMIAADFSSYTIAKRLKMSTATIKRFRKLFDGGAYEYLATELKKLKDQEVFWETLEKISRGGLPPVVGKSFQPTLLQKRTKKK